MAAKKLKKENKKKKKKLLTTNCQNQYLETSSNQLTLFDNFLSAYLYLFTLFNNFNYLIFKKHILIDG